MEIVAQQNHKTFSLNNRTTTLTGSTFVGSEIKGNKIAAHNFMFNQGREKSVPSNFTIDIFEYLQQFKSDIKQAALNYGINAAVIPAIIASEYNLGSKSHFTNHLQKALINGTDWGKHSEEAASLCGRKKESECTNLETYIKMQIPKIAKAIKTHVITFSKESNGMYIGNNIALLAFLYNRGLVKTKQIANLIKLKTSGSLTKSVQLNVSTNTITKWVTTNKNKFQDFYTKPKAPLRAVA